MHTQQKPVILSRVAKTTGENEFYTPIPQGYSIGKTKYVIVYGTVMSGLGKGIFSSSLAKLLKFRGLKVAPIKFDGYLNRDAGTLNPYRHGEVFVLDDGTESDMDLGTYERFLDHNITKHNYLTGGKIFHRILNREREGKYLGRDVQFIPHVTGEIKLFLRELALKTKADIVFVEVGGTVGDIENNYFIEAMRELTYEEGMENVVHIALTYVLEPRFLGEQKTKAAQLGIRSLMSMGIQPSIVPIRAANPVTAKSKEKISVFSNVAVNRVVSVHNLKSIYLLPSLLHEEKIDVEILDLLGLTSKNSAKGLQEWEGYAQKILSLKENVTVGITGKYTGLRDSYASIINALEHAGVEIGVKIDIKWIDTESIENGKINTEKALKGVHGIIVPGGFGKRGAEGKILCIKHARENQLPYLGLCYGFQMGIVEFARNVAGIKDAQTTEINAETAEPVIDILPEQKKIEGLGGTMRLGGRDIEVKKGTKAYELYGHKEIIRERFRHRYECNPSYISKLEENGLVFSGKAPKHPIMQILELPDHPFFIGVQFHPEFTSRPMKSNPLYLGFVKAVVKNSK